MGDQITNPVKAIRAHCKECCGGVYPDVKSCTDTKCALYAFRMGKNPFRTKRVLTEDQKRLAAERLRKAREKKQEDDSV